MNFVFSFRDSRPKHIFLVHGEEESQIVLKDKIESEAEIPVTIPEYGETYDLQDVPVVINKVEHKPLTIRGEILQILGKLQNEIDDMKDSVKQDLEDKTLRDEDMFRIKEKMKDLEENILKIIEG